MTYRYREEGGERDQQDFGRDVVSEPQHDERRYDYGGNGLRDD